MVYQIPQLSKQQNVIHGVSTRSEGNMSLTWGLPEQVSANREAFLKTSKITEDACVVMRPQHSDGISIVDARDAGRGMIGFPEAVIADGLITTERGLFLSLMAADCFPVFIVDPVLGIVALTHAGWKSTHLHIVAKAITAFTADFGSDVDTLIAAIGPGIQRASFRFINPIQKQYAEWSPFLHDGPDGYTSVDVAAFIKMQLKATGVAEAHIFDSRIDTAENELFFSHYRDSRLNPSTEGRFMCFVGLSRLNP